MNELHKQRIRHLIALLRVRKPEKFVIVDWFDENWIEQNYPKKPLSCKTPACAMGLACLDPEFNRQGLTAVDRNGIITPVHNNSDTGDSVVGNDIAQSFFGIEKNASEFIFFEIGYQRDPDNITPDMVADKLERLLRGIVPVPLENI